MKRYTLFTLVCASTFSKYLVQGLLLSCRARSIDSRYSWILALMLYELSGMDENKFGIYRGHDSMTRSDNDSIMAAAIFFLELPFKIPIILLLQKIIFRISTDYGITILRISLYFKNMKYCTIFLISHHNNN